MANDRTPRDLTARDKMARPVYQPPSTLPEPNPEPGYVFRWVATHVLGTAEPTNVSRKMRDGWIPVKGVDYPELMLPANEVTGNVEIGGLMLCKMSRERAESMKEYYDRQAALQMESVDNNYMRNSDPKMPLFVDRKSEVNKSVFGSGTK